MNARIFGNGELTLVLGHGYGGSQYVWDDVLPGLIERYRVVVFDWSFSGAIETPVDLDAMRYSSYDAFAEDLISLMDDMNLRGAAFVGHSMSGMIGCIAAVKRPELFSHIVLIVASPRYINEEGYEGGFTRTQIDDLLSNIESNFVSWAQNFLPIMAGENYPDSHEKIVRSFLRMRPETALLVGRMIFLGDYRDVLEKVEVPCTIVYGTKDPAVPTAVANYMQSKIKGTVPLEPIESGHFPHLTAPQRLLDILHRVL